MSTKQEILDQLAQDISFYQVTAVNAAQKAEKAMQELKDWGYTWSFETGLVKLPEGETNP